jgi:hypothetical protein
MACGEDPRWAFHLVNWLLHGVVSGCVAEFARRISSTRIALIAGLLFCRASDPRRGGGEHRRPRRS